MYVEVFSGTGSALVLPAPAANTRQVANASLHLSNLQPLQHLLGAIDSWHRLEQALGYDNLTQD